jgi:phosphoserine phosphatase
MNVFVDFDDVLFHTKKFLQEMVAITEGFGISEEVFRITYEELRADEGGQHFCYRFDKHIEKMSHHADFDQGALLKELEEFLADTKKFLFPDAKYFLKFLQEKNYNTWIVSYGDSGFQTNKIQGTGIQHLVRDAVVVQDGKDRVIASLVAGSTAKSFFFDDRVSFLESVKKAAPKIQTVLVQRPEGRFSDIPNSYVDRSILSLEEAGDLFVK